jgi:phenylpyruvate tautomerase PptA (4-oxalocrotonate tautomerase family)
VLDAAVKQIDEAYRTPATKAKMAERILRATSEGVTGVQDLITVAVEEGKQPAD